MIRPINGYLLIDPVKHEQFMDTGSSTYDEVGIVLDLSEGVEGIQKGDKVLFDSYMAKKYPKGDGGTYWFIHKDEIAAVEHE